MNYLEVKVLEVSPAVVKFNFEEMSAYAKQLAEDYKGLTFDEETVKEGKKTVAELKKIQKSVNDFKIKTKKKLTESVTLFETQCKDIIAEFDEPIDFISTQLVEFETERIRVKTLSINSLISQGYEQAEIEPKFQTIEFKTDWLNATKKEKEFMDELTYELKQCASNQNAYYSNCELVETYIKLANSEYGLGVGLDVQQFVKVLDYKTIEEVKQAITSQAQRQQQSELEYKARIEAQAIAQAQIKATEVITQATQQIEKLIPVEKQESDPLYERTIRVKGTKAQFVSLKSYLEQIGIEVLL